MYFTNILYLLPTNTLMILQTTHSPKSNKQCFTRKNAKIYIGNNTQVYVMHVVRSVVVSVSQQCHHIINEAMHSIKYVNAATFEMMERVSHGNFILKTLIINNHQMRKKQVVRRC